MEGVVLFCDPVSFSAKDGSVISGYRICVSYVDYRGSHHVAEVWQRNPWYPDTPCRVVRRRRDCKLFIFKVGESVGEA